MPSTRVIAPGTRTQWTERRLRDAILSGELGPGTPLRAEELAQRWSVSPTPVREALQRLAGVGLVALRPQRGAVVAEASVRDMEEVYELRLLLEPVALRESLERSDAALIADIDAGYRVYAQTFTADADAGSADLRVDIGAMFDAHRAFHAALLARCPNQRLLETVATLAEHSQRFQVLALGAPGGHHDVVAEHRTLHDHAVAGRVEDAVAFLTAHLQATLDGARAAS